MKINQLGEEIAGYYSHDMIGDFEPVTFVKREG